MKNFLDIIGLSSIITVIAIFTIDDLMVLELFIIGYVLAIIVDIVRVVTFKEVVTEAYTLVLVVGAGLGSTTTSLLLTKLIDY